MPQLTRPRCVTFTPKEGITFTLDERYTLRRLVGSGAFGMVAECHDHSDPDELVPVPMAIKKIPDILRHPAVTRAAGMSSDLPPCPHNPTRCGAVLRGCVAVREVMLLRLVGGAHPNVLGIKDLMLDDKGSVAQPFARRPAIDHHHTRPQRLFTCMHTRNPPHMQVDLYVVSPLMDTDLHRVITSNFTGYTRLAARYYCILNRIAIPRGTGGQVAAAPPTQPGGGSCGCCEHVGVRMAPLLPRRQDGTDQ